MRFLFFNPGNLIVLSSAGRLKGHGLWDPGHRVQVFSGFEFLAFRGVGLRVFKVISRDVVIGPTGVRGLGRPTYEGVRKESLSCFGLFQCNPYNLRSTRTHLFE